MISEIAPRPSSLMRETHKDVAVSIVKMSDMVLNRRKDVWRTLLVEPVAGGALLMTSRFATTCDSSAFPKAGVRHYADAVGRRACEYLGCGGVR